MNKIISVLNFDSIRNIIPRRISNSYFLINNKIDDQT